MTAEITIRKTVMFIQADNAQALGTKAVELCGKDSVRVLGDYSYLQVIEAKPPAYMYDVAKPFLTYLESIGTDYTETAKVLVEVNTDEI